MHFKGWLQNLKVIAGYTPTNATDDTAKDAFHDLLQILVNRVPRRDLPFAAKGKTSASALWTNPHVIAWDSCENGSRLVNSLDMNRVVVCNSHFQHPKKHLLAWYSNNGRTMHHFDFMLERFLWASLVDDCRPYRGATTGNMNGSD